MIQLLYVKRKVGETIMTGKTHILGGVAAGLATSYVFMEFTEYKITVVTLAIGIITSATVALLPDVDEIHSTISHRLVVLPLLFFLLQIVWKIRILFAPKSKKSILQQKARNFQHRGICHYLITWTIISMILGLTSWILYINKSLHEAILGILIGFCIGYLSHILLDLISGKIPVLAPFCKKSIGITLFKTGSIFEIILVRPLLLLICGNFIYQFIK